MKLTPKVSQSFKQKTPSDKTTFGANVVNSLTPVMAAKKSKIAQNDLPIPVADLQAINTQLNTAIADALTGNHAAIASVKNLVIEWDAAFGTTASYISLQADGDVQAIRETGFIPTKSETTPAQKPGPTTGFKATINGSRGAILAGTKKRAPGAKYYVFSAVPDGAVVTYVNDTMVITVGDKTIYITTGTARQTEIYNLKSGLPYNVSMLAVNTAGWGPAADPQQVIPQ